MDSIRRIKIENIKGKDSFEMVFSNLMPNQPNIIVAPNGYGKSTVTTAFKASMHGNMKLDKRDIYKQNENNHPKLSIELSGDHAGVFTATDTNSNISANLTIGARKTTSADLRVEDVVIYNSIPERVEFEYSFTKIKSSFGDKGKLFLNISNMLSSYYNVRLLYKARNSISKCISQARIQNSFNGFLAKCPGVGSISKIKSEIPPSDIENLRLNANVATLLDCINAMSGKPENWQNVDAVFTAIQILKIIQDYNGNGEPDIIKKVYSYLEYKNTREVLDTRLDEFNTTGRVLKTREDHGKLIVKFERAQALSNGERDILSFVVNLTKFEQDYKKTIGILIIDEVFDYLDGSNMLAVQYYLTELIDTCKKNGKILFPIIFTHLDPAVFSNYYFNKKKIHYISFSATPALDSDLISMLRLRESGSISEEEKKEIEKYFLHYIGEEHSLNEGLARRISADFSDSNKTFREKIYKEITEKYLQERCYTPTMVIAGVRLKIEEKLYFQLAEEQRDGFIDEHRAINKMNYAAERGVDVPELFYLLQPLYNDGLHLRGNDEAVQNKIKSTYLKTNNLHIRKMIGELFKGE